MSSVAGVGAAGEEGSSSSPRSGRWLIGAVVGAVLGAVILGPALAPGYTLHYDLVFVPDLPFSARTLGTDGSVPRAVPNDLVAAVLSTVLPGWLVQKVLLLGSLVAAGAGAARLAATRSGALAAAVLYVWNPWVGERLGIGHWGYLMGYAALPWVLLAAVALVTRGRGRGRAWGLAGALALASLGGSTAGVLSVLLALVAVLVTPRSLPCEARALGGPSRLRDRAVPTPVGARGVAAALVLGVGLLVNASWWWPFLTAASRAADPAGVSVFAARADTPFGVLGSALLGGGLWNERTWFAEREGLLGAGVALLATLALLALASGRRRWWDDPVQRPATVAGGIGLLLAVLPATGPGAAVVEALVRAVPGAGLLRDSQKLVALTVLLLTVAAARLGDRLSRARATPLVACLVAWPVATLPTLAVGHLGRWGSVSYPAEHLEVAQLVDDGGPGSLLVLPWMTYRRYAWDGDRVVLDPWNRLVARDVLSSDDLPVSGQVVSGEDPRGAEVARLLDADPSPQEARSALRSLGVRYVVLDRSQPSPAGTAVELGDRPVLSAGDLELHDLGDPSGAAASPRPTTAPVGLVVSVLSWLAIAAGWARQRWSSRRPTGRPAPGTCDDGRDAPGSA